MSLKSGTPNVARTVEETLSSMDKVYGPLNEKLREIGADDLAQVKGGLLRQKSFSLSRMTYSIKTY
jgi:hypothetical protein